MTLSLHLIRLFKDNQENIAKERLESMKEGEKEKKTYIHALKILSPETIRRNVSNDNFLKFQWPWTV